MYIVVYEWEDCDEVIILAIVKFNSKTENSEIRKFVNERFGKRCMWESVDYIEAESHINNQD